MTSSKGAGAGPAPRGILRANWPLALLLVLAVALAVPAGLSLVPGFVGPPAPAAVEPVHTPAWQQLPTAPATRSGISPLKDSAPVPQPDAVAAALEPLLMPDGDGTFTAHVQDALTGQVLFSRGGTDARVPASNTKLLTAAAALRTMDPDHRFSTTVFSGAEPGTVVLRGGGDVLLSAGESAPDQVLGHAGLATLAADTVASLQAAGATGAITVQVDDSLFSGPSLNPSWELGDVQAGETAPIFPLALNSARFDAAVTKGPRPQDSAMAAAEAFAQSLRTAGAAAGLTVTADVGRSVAPDGAQVLATAQSATVAEQVALMLQTSDNYLAEVLGRMAALAAGLPGSNDGAASAVLAEVAKMGISTDAMALADVSGLTMDNRVSAAQLTAVVLAMTTGADPRLREALPGLPVAALTGTLGERYGSGQESAGGAGLVRAKTGTLNTVLALSGYVVDADGRLLVFSFVGNGLTPGAAGNKPALDRAAAALAGCGCR
ncbi:D-alanyl-D-alanine carboxypeptidase/D-alanyl-D-alanine-endopeptidase [Pseudarthrobacter sp. J64]|uniref:D-alanyl-D-alanine carboxypeptidase/D-alanyl-D-alanine endopeptidase n=1 Tax=Pseudarthrobacter sp. J64 TaxID=3116485 RepID=UPI002E809220|nr:D-alanyl-D-alanine carboxypeptidase/D-alanyl-D-alanine-endopeptidase [Pseudarthrobacter sp. J64]MEE2570297.1 D-alanyl-D-alanine carboxypeptidase/D-alanyl-D-alanine-endopeptidase [Pseudarthrobacter sp. J64]